MENASFQNLNFPPDVLTRAARADSEFPFRARVSVRAAHASTSERDAMLNVTQACSVQQCSFERQCIHCDNAQSTHMHATHARERDSTHKRAIGRSPARGCTARRLQQRRFVIACARTGDLHCGRLRSRAGRTPPRQRRPCSRDWLRFVATVGAVSAVACFAR